MTDAEWAIQDRKNRDLAEASVERATAKREAKEFEAMVASKAKAKAATAETSRVYCQYCGCIANDRDYFGAAICDNCR